MIDFEYLCEKMSDMAGLPIRIYKNKNLIYSYCVFPLIKDPIVLHIDSILSLTKHVDYYMTSDFDIYGIVNGKDFSIVIGPSLPIDTSLQMLKKKAFDLNIDNDSINEFVNELNSLVRMPLNSLLQILCTINYLVNDEKLNLSDLQAENKEQEYPSIELSEQDSYRSYLVEKTICDFIMNGDLLGFNEWTKKAPTVKPGKIGNDTIRQHKNIFVVSATIFSRCAIEAGIGISEALQLSDYYIQQAENKESIDDITALQFTMLSEYISKVAKIKELNINNYLAKKVYTYVHNNLSKYISTKEIADYLKMSRSYLSTLFKKETGHDLKDYILLIKINHAKELLINSDNSLVSIATYLGFSSSSHFTRVFKSYEMISPLKYRETHKT